MLHFREHQWLLAPGTSRFTAWIEPKDKKPEDLRWLFALTYHAGGPQWRRVPAWRRPSLIIQNFNFRPRIQHWTELEQVTFWSPGDDLHDDSGYLFTEFSLGPKKTPVETSLFSDHIWRVAGRDRRWFTLEFAGFINCENFFGKPEESLVTSTGQPASSDGEAEFWKANAQLYLVEDLPFGMVTVQIPRNVRDPQTYALRRTHALLGLERPEHLEISDYAQSPHGHEFTRGDIYVHLHFHGYYED